MGVPVSIVIPAHNQLAYCRQCINAILLHTPEPHRLILVDNGSTDGVGEFFDAVPGATVIHAGENRGFAGGVNLGIAASEGAVLLLNSDTLVPQGWLSTLMGALSAASDIGLVGPRSNCVSGAQEITGLRFDTLEEINAYAARLRAEQAGRLRDVARLVGFCLLIRREVIGQVGLFDEGYGVGNFEDDDYCLRAQRAGWRCCIAEDAFVFHYGSRTFAGMGIVGAAWQDLLAQNARRFEEKLGARMEERMDEAQQARQLRRQGGEAASMGDIARALDCFQRAIRLAPWAAEGHLEMARLLDRMGERGRARRFYALALERDAGLEEARARLAALDAETRE